MIHELLARIDTRCLGAIRTARVGVNVDRQRLILWLKVKHPPPPNWLYGLTVTLLHDDGATLLECRCTWIVRQGSELEAWLDPIGHVPNWRKHFIITNAIPQIPVSYVTISRQTRFRGRRSRRFKNLSSLKAYMQR